MKTSLKRNLCVILAVVVSLGCANSGNPVVAKKRIKLSRKNVTVCVNKAKEISLKNATKKVKWSISNKLVATIYPNGKNKKNCMISARNEGDATITAKVGGKKYKCKVKVISNSGKSSSSTTEKTMINLQNTYNANFDKVVQKVRKEGEFSTYGGYCTYGYVSVSASGDSIEFFESHDRKGHCVKIEKGSKMATAIVELKAGVATATFDISTFKGDTSDMLNWDNSPEISNALSYNVAVANVLKNVANYSFYMGDIKLQQLGFESYLF